MSEVKRVYMVWSEGGKITYHSSYVDAHKEAERLAANSPGRDLHILATQDVMRAAVHYVTDLQIID